MNTAARIVVASLLALTPCVVHAQQASLPDGRRLAKIDFERHVQALLDRQGCNAGKCHGNRNGQGGLSFSLLSGSPLQDYMKITRGGHGRYLNMSEPDRSLLLLKATGQLKHDGGVRIVPQSWQYQVLRQWIVGGARHMPGSGEIKSIRVEPNEHVFKPGETLRLKVIAQFADGAEEDVTCFSDFRIMEQESVELEPEGIVHAEKPGDVGIAVFYRGRMRVMRARIAVPLAQGKEYPRVPEEKFIDRELFPQLRRLNIVPAELCTDEQFLRRVTIDMLGTLPTPAEVRDFVANKDREKRTKKIEELLAHPRHASLLAMMFCDLTELTASNDIATSPRARAAQMAHDWFRARLQQNMPYDQIVEGVLTATSKEGRDGSAWEKEKAALTETKTGFGTDYAQRSTLDHYWRACGLLTRDDRDFERAEAPGPAVQVDKLVVQTAAERTAAAFLGIDLECARCHIHPLDGWTPADHQAFCNLFAQLRMETVPFENVAIEDWERAAFARQVYLGEPANQFRDAATGDVVPARLLDGPEVRFDGDARLTLVRWMARPDNPYFARNFAKKMWEHYLGVSPVESVDRFTSSLPAAQRTVLDVLAKDFVDHGFDIRWLERTILMSRTYQLSSATNASNEHDRTNFSHAGPLRPDPRVIANMIHAVLDIKEDFGPGVPPGLHATEVMHPGETVKAFGSRDGYGDRIDRTVVRFGREELVSRCAGGPDLRSYLHHLSNPRIGSIIENSPRVQRLASSKLSIDEIIDETFMVTLSRLPNAEVRQQARKHLQLETIDRARAVQDIFWALINTREFLMRH